MSSEPGPSASSAARMLVARSRRLARPVAIGAEFRLAGGTERAAPVGGTLPAPRAGRPTAGPPATAAPAPGEPFAVASFPPGPSPAATISSGRDADEPPRERAGPPATSRGAAASEAAGVDVVRGVAGAIGSVPLDAPAVEFLLRPTVSPGERRAAGPGRLPGHDGTPPRQGPAATGEVAGPEPGAATGSPLIERVRRAAPPVAVPEQGAAPAPERSGARRAGPPSPELAWRLERDPAVGEALADPAPAEPGQVAERGVGVRGTAAGPRAGHQYPPVTIGEIHVHVSEPGGGPDPLALLAPYARGLTARRDGAR
jgi:hypothetical protein